MLRQTTILIVSLLFLAPASLDELKARFAKERKAAYDVRMKTVNEIAALGTEAAVRFLTSVIEEDADRSVQLNTIHSLARIPLRSAFEALVTLWRDGPENNRGTVFHALSYNRKEEIPADIVKEILGGRDQGARSNLVRYFGRRDDPRFIPEAQRFLAEFPKASSSLVSTLVQILTVESAPILIRVYDDGRQYDTQQVPAAFAKADEAVQGVLLDTIAEGPADLAGAAAVIAGRAELKTAEPAIVKRLPKANPLLRVVLLETLGKIGAESAGARAAVRKALADKDEAVVTAAVRALRGMPDKDAIPTLIDLLERGARALAVEAQVTLERITGQQFGDRVDLWRKWWKNFGEAFEPKDVKKPSPDALDQALVNLAIEKGAAALKRIRGEDVPWEFSGHKVGTTALVVLALHAAGVGKKDRAMRAGLAYIVKAPVPEKTYETAIVAMALEAVDRKRFKRHILKCGKRLIETQLPEGLWGYPTGAGDHSNTQYAVLGLRAAARSGMKVPPRVWRSVRDHLYRHRCEDGGWSYTPTHLKTSSTSMTAAGISCLLICYENLKLDEAGKTRILKEIDRGCEALGEKMKLDKDTLYALYGIERAGVLGRRGAFGGHPWYVPGAKRLLSEQGRDGFWRRSYNEAVQTSFAILFLKKFTAPIETR
jgi:HEAT repeat protein